MIRKGSVHHFHQLLALKEEESALRLSDSADWNIGKYLHAKANLARPFKSVLDLEGAFQGIPAILVGAGPSLEKNGHLLAGWARQALIFSGGSALNKMPCEPHFGSAIDNRIPIPYLQKAKMPLCFQARMHPDNLCGFQGEPLLAPDSHFSFLNYLAGGTDRFDTGWTVGNFMAALALHFGCNPIVAIGMEYCYNEDKKYAFGATESLEGLIETEDGEGNRVWTQRDWLMAVQWMENLRHSNRAVKFLNGTEGGMGYWTPCVGADLDFPEIVDLEKLIERSIQKLPICHASRFMEWEQSLARSLEMIRNENHAVKQEIVYSQLLLPLWNLWEPVFEQAPSSHSTAIKMRIHQRIFFEKVLQEHLHAIS